MKGSGSTHCLQAIRLAKHTNATRQHRVAFFFLRPEPHEPRRRIMRHTDGVASLSDQLAHNSTANVRRVESSAHHHEILQRCLRVSRVQSIKTTTRDPRN
jgi:hypothetical protein